MFKSHVTKSENLLKAKLIMIPYFKNSHHTLYVMNRYTGTLDIFDTRRYSGFHITRGAFHEEHVEIMRRMVLLMKEVYGVQEYNKRNTIPWELKADGCNYVYTSEQGANECGLYVLQIACTYDGEKFVEKIKNKDKSVED